MRVLGKIVRKSAMVMVAGAFAYVTFMAGAQAASRKENAEELVADATETLRYFAQANEFVGLQDTAGDAKAMVIIPASYRAGFLFGGSGGNGVMVARNPDGSWSGPTFLSIGAVSFGLQAGGEVSEIVLLVMTERGKEGLLSSSVKLGGDISIAAGPVGVGAKAQTVDVLAFSRSRGLYGGLSVEGAILDTKKKWNRAYYDADVSAVDVVFRGVRDNPVSLPLREAAYQLANRRAGNAASAQYTAQASQGFVDDPNRVRLADPTTVTPPAGRVYSAPGQLDNNTAGQTAGAVQYQGANYQTDQYPVHSTDVAPAVQRVDENGFPVLLGEEQPVYEDDNVYGAPLRRPEPNQP